MVERSSVRGPIMDSVTFEALALLQATNAILSDVRHTSKRANVRFRIWSIATVAIAIFGIALLLFGDSFGKFLLGGGAICFLVAFEAYNTKSAFRDATDRYESELLSRGFNCEWSDRDYFGKRWAKIDSISSPFADTEVAWE